MKAYLSFFKIRFFTGIQYRAAAIAGIITQLAWGFMYIMIYNGFYKSNPSAVSVEISDISSYIWLQQSFLALFMAWIIDEDVLEQISSGNVAYEICRPLDIYNMWFVKNAANRISKAILRCFPIIIISSLLPGVYRLQPPDSIASFILFLLSMILALIVVLGYTMLIYIFSFYTISPIGIKMIMIMLADFFSGSLIPLPLLPDSIKDIFYLSPFGAMQNTPFMIYSGVLSNMESIKHLLVQVFWAIILIVLGRLIMRKAMRKVVVQGG